MGIKQWAVAAAVTSLAFLLLDSIWIAITGPWLYRPALAAFMAATINVPAALGFYVCYIPAIVILAVRPAIMLRSAGTALIHGFALGLAGYSTYDLTNLAMLRDWPAQVSLIDLAWGCFATTMAALVGYRAAR